jgi:hypothetical protein
MAQHLLSLLGWFDPKWAFLLVTAFLWFVTWLWRIYAPGIWAAVAAKSPTLTQLPLVVLGTLLVANPVPGKAMFDVIQQAILQAVLAVLGANGLHSVMKASTLLPYTGAEKKVAAAFVKRNTPPDGLPSLDKPPVV